MSFWQALNSILKEALALWKYFFLKLYQFNVLEQINGLSVIINASTGTLGAAPSEAGQIKSKIYNVLNIIKLDFPPLGLGTRLLEASGQCVCRAPMSHCSKN